MTIRIIFSDSLAHLNASLSELVSNLTDDPAALAPIRSFVVQEYGDDESKFKALLRKGVYPYDYMSSPERFQETKLPDIEHFHNSLTNEPCSQADYQHAMKVWKLFGMKTMKDYCELYVKSDVVQLTAVMHKYREESMESYGLDPIHYYSAPG